MTDEIDDKVDYSLKQAFDAKQKHSKLSNISQKVESIEDRKVDVKIAHQAIIDCTNQILILQKNLEIYSDRIKSLTTLIDELAKELEREKKDDS